MTVAAAVVPLAANVDTVCAVLTKYVPPTLLPVPVPSAIINVPVNVVLPLTACPTAQVPVIVPEVVKVLVVVVIVVPPDVAVVCVGLTTQLVPEPETIYVPGIMLPPDSTWPMAGVPPLVVNVVPVIPPVIVLEAVAMVALELVATAVGFEYV